MEQMGFRSVVKHCAIVTNQNYYDRTRVRVCVVRYQARLFLLHLLYKASEVYYELLSHCSADASAISRTMHQLSDGIFVAQFSRSTLRGFGRIVLTIDQPVPRMHRTVPNFNYIE